MRRGEERRGERRGEEEERRVLIDIVSSAAKANLRLWWFYTHKGLYRACMYTSSFLPSLPSYFYI
jgi:hypothetical protein